MTKRFEAKSTDTQSVNWPRLIAHPATQTVALILITLIAYGPAFGAGFIWDDDDYVTNNQTLRSAEGLKRIWLEPGAVPQYYPLVHTMFWIEYRLWGVDSAAGFHAVNIVLHAIGAVLLWLILRRLKLSAITSWLAAAVFALHPIHVESVAWVTERKNVLSALFYFLALLAYFRFNRSSTDGADGTSGLRNWRWYGMALVCFMLALLSKTVTCSLPAAILLLIWWKRGRIGLKDFTPLTPLFVLGIAFGLVTAWMEKHHVGAQGEDWSLNGLQRLLLAGQAAWFYASTIAWPVDLAFVYPRWTIDAHDWRQWIPLIAAVALIGTLFVLRHRLGRGPLVAMLFFGGTLFPALGFFDVYPFRFSYVADHFQHLASIGITTLLTVVVVHGIQRALPRTRSAGLGVFGIVLVATLGVLTWRQCGVYHDLRTLWEDTLRKNPDSYMPHYNLGKVCWQESNELLAQGRNAEGIAKSNEAIGHYERAVKARPNLVEAMNNIGFELARQGRNDEALGWLNRAIEADSKFVDAYHTRGTLLARQGQYEPAIADLERAVALNAKLAAARIDLGMAYAKSGRLTDAEKVLREALAINANDVRAMYNLGLTLESQGRIDDAATQFGEVWRLDPTLMQAALKLGTMFRSQGRIDESIRVLTEAVDRGPNYVDVRSALVQSLTTAGRRTEATAHVRQITQMLPNDPRPHAQLARLLLDESNARLRNPTEAIALAQKAVALSGAPLKAQMLDLLAETHAAAGDFAAAAQAQEQAIIQARLNSQTDLEPGLQQRLERYRAQSTRPAATQP